MMMAAEIQTFAAPAMPCCATATAMKGTVTADTPPIRTGLRPKSAQTGDATMDVTTPRIGGRPINDASARPYGKATSPATRPPAVPPPKAPQPYPPIDPLHRHGIRPSKPHALSESPRRYPSD